jgi:ketosteroid isomerase-like protein
VIALTDPKVEWHSFFAELGDEGVYRGHGGIRQYLSDLDDAWEIVRADVDDGVGVGDVAVLFGRIHYRGRFSGIETETPAGWMVKFRDGRAVCIRAFREPEKALEAVGLEGQAVSQENVEMALAITDALNAGDLDRWIEFFTSDVEAFPDVSVWPESRALHGRAKFLSFITDVLNAWTQFRLETVEVFAVGDDRVVWRGDWHGTGAASGLNTSTSLTTVSTVRDRQVARIEYYFDHNQALEAVGLEK